jgi:hypothetical protein
LTPVDIQNAWGSEPLAEPAPPDAAEEGAEHLFGSWIVVLDYKDEQDSEGQQFIVSSREAAIKPTGGDIQPKAGRAFPFLQPMPDP